MRKRIRVGLFRHRQRELSLKTREALQKACLGAKLEFVPVAGSDDVSYLRTLRYLDFVLLKTENKDYFSFLSAAREVPHVFTGENGLLQCLIVNVSSTHWIPPGSILRRTA